MTLTFTSSKNQMVIPAGQHPEQRSVDVSPHPRVVPLFSTSFMIGLPTQEGIKTINNRPTNQQGMIQGLISSARWQVWGSPDYVENQPSVDCLPVEYADL